MTDEFERRLLKFLDGEFIKLTNPRPRVIFRAKDVIAGSLSARQPPTGWPKSVAISNRGLHIAMGKFLTGVVNDNGYVGGYCIRSMGLNPARGTRFMATKTGTGDDAK